MQKRFDTKYRYVDRQTKAKYVWLKYQPLLTGRVLDVGADQCYIKEYLPKDVDYWGVGLGGSPDQLVNLEHEKVPFSDDSFDCILCLDVLEHLNNIHEIFDELCRVTRRYVIISLPSPWASLFQALILGYYRPNQPMKQYGLPVDVVEDRHKWFYSNDEAQRFITYRAKKNGMQVAQMDNYSSMHFLRRMQFGLLRIALPKINLNVADLYGAQLWTVLEKVS